MRSRSPVPLFLVVLACTSSACSGDDLSGEADRGFGDGSFEPTGAIRVVTVRSGLSHPWGLTFLPDRRMLVTERAGALYIVAANGSSAKEIGGVPDVRASGQGGLLDVAIDPAFADNGRVYLSFAEPGEDGTAGTAVARGNLVDERLEDVTVIYRQEPKTAGGNHFGSRLVFADDGTLFVTQGDRAEQRERAQDLSMLQGKVVRIATDGSIPADNPFVGRVDARPEIWSYGHRNMQGAALHPVTRTLWTNEHGAQGGDELNAPESGKNYGWPVITYGRDYDGSQIGLGTAQEGMEQPVHYWDPSIAPSGLAFYTGDAIPEWRGSALIGSMKFSRLVRLALDGNRIVGEERLLADVDERIRDVRQGPDGLVYLLTDADDGRILRIEPAR
ncbi:MAG: PQQ-dependent sugar dehydrogenase [Clostridia bacterium]|nr:PQQ-dependent sugar dehydrogenase [Deltaproteobacteria bacterium]